MYWEGINKFFKACSKGKGWDWLRGFGKSTKPYPGILVLSEIAKITGIPEYPVFSKISNPASLFMISWSLAFDSACWIWKIKISQERPLPSTKRYYPQFIYHNAPNKRLSSSKSPYISKDHIPKICHKLITLQTLLNIFPR